MRTILHAAAVFLTTALAATHASAQETQTYTYDIHGRLTRVDRTTGSTTVATVYGIDDANNRTSRTIGPPPPPPPPPPPLSVSLSANTWTSAGYPPVTATPSGGVPPYGYQWTYVSGSPRPKPTAPTSASTEWVVIIPQETTQVAQFRVTVTDAIGGTAQSSQVQVSVYPDE